MLRHLVREFIRRTHLHRLAVLIMTIVTVFPFSGCASASSIKTYEDSQFGVKLQYPSHWELESGGRVDNFILLQAERGLFKKDSVRIEMLVSLPSAAPLDLEEGLYRRIGNKRDLYELESTDIIQPPTLVESEDFEIAIATIAVPTMSVPERSRANQMGVRDPDVSQIVDMYVIRNDNYCHIEINVYKGNSEELNVEAEDIVDSIELTC